MAAGGVLEIRDIHSGALKEFSAIHTFDDVLFCNTLHSTRSNSDMVE